jgi:acyl-CoA thioesterase FadM
VALRVVRIGRSSVDFAYEVRSRANGKVTTTAKATTVLVNLDTFEPVNVPEPLRGRLAAQIQRGDAERGAGGGV